MTTRHTEADARIAIDDRLRQAGWDPLDKSMVGTEVQAAVSLATNWVVDRSRARAFESHAPVYDLEAAAGAFGPDRTVGAAGDESGWAPVPESVRLTREHFVVRVSGQSMEPTIPDGSHCLFRTERGGSRQGKLVLVWQRGAADPALGGEFSVKKYESTKGASADGDWSHREIRLKPLNPDPAFRNLVFTPEAEGNLHVIGEFVAVLDLPAPTVTSGRADYVLYDQRGRPLAVIEAKRNAINPYVAKQQALPYAKALGAPFIFLTNGELTYFWDYQNDDARGITEIVAEGAEIDDEHYDPVAFERRWTNEESNRLMMREFDRIAQDQYRELAPGQEPGPGKAIVFAITKHHAARLARHLNELHPEHQGRYAEVITSDVADPDALIRRFKTEPFPMVAVSVGMLDTGFNCREVLHLVLCRRVRSPILYQQMRGRGTRTAPHIGKRKFVIFDFFRNHQYFNDSDEDVFTGSGGGRPPSDPPTAPPPPGELVDLGLDDEWLQAVTYVEVGPEGEHIDKDQYVSDWQKTVRSRVADDSLLRKVRDDERLDPDEEDELARRLNRPERYINEENLRRAYRDPGGTLIDFIRAALGRLRIKSREEKIEETFRAWLVSRSLTPNQAAYLCLLKNRLGAGGGMRLFPRQAERYRWSKWRFRSGNDLRDFVRDEVFAYMASLVKDEPQVAEYFRDAVLEIVDPNVLKQVIDELDSIDFRKLGPDVKGDIFQYLLTHLGQSALNGQFRTPRQIRAFMVEMVAPEPGDTVYDPASGTAGFLIDVVDYVLARYSEEPEEVPIYGEDWLERRGQTLEEVRGQQDASGSTRCGTTATTRTRSRAAAVPRPRRRTTFRNCWRRGGCTRRPATASHRVSRPAPCSMPAATSPVAGGRVLTQSRRTTTT